MELIIRAPKSDEEFKQMFDLRWRLLRKPWNQPKGSEKDDKEDSSFSFIAIINQKIVGTIRLHLNEQEQGQFSHLAVNDEYQRQGLATLLIMQAERFAKTKGLSSIFITGTETIQPFFERNGYQLLKQGSNLFGEIEQYIFRKNL